MDNRSCEWKCYIVLFLLLMPFLTCFSQAKGKVVDDKDIILNTTGLKNEKFVRAIFLGDFLAIEFDRDVLEFANFLQAYITVFGEQCGKSLPENSRVQLTYQKCKNWRVYTNGWGMEVRRDCLNWVTKPLDGMFASKGIIEAQDEVKGIHQAAPFLTMGKTFPKNEYADEAILSMIRISGEIEMLEQDMHILFSKNDCNSPGMLRFEENLRLFAKNKRPIIFGDSSSPNFKAILSKNQDYKKLIETLIFNQSRVWLLNEFVSGSVEQVDITSADKDGFPAEIQAYYKFKGLFGLTTGAIRITFTDGLPECMYFSDFPTICRTANRRTVARYAAGDFQL